MIVHLADSSATEGARRLLAAHHHAVHWMHEIQVDQEYQHELETWMHQQTTIRLHIIATPQRQQVFTVIPTPWVVERSMAWAGHHRLARNAHNCNPESGEALLNLGSVVMLLNQLYQRCSCLITL